MSIWILTIGNSDVQLKSENHNWTKLFRGDARKQADGLGFIPEKSRLENCYTVEARVMGLTYSQPKAKEFVGDLCFPLIDNFSSKLKDKSVERIILILSDQQDAFTSSKRRCKRCPYWQDTCELQPILENYLKSKDCFVDATIDEPIILKPSSPNDGLDNWDETLELVRREFSGKFPHELPEDEIVYVSHQAGTPAISSAVQFVSLAKFGDRTRFLVSSEQQTRPPEILPSSAYLKGIRFQEARALLDNHDYSGVEKIASSYLNLETKTLLDAAIQWNLAKFDEFAKKVLTCSDDFLVSLVRERTRKENWWWMAYESAYISIIRLNQESVVDAMFHSFRALEGLLKEWALQTYKEQIKYSNQKQPKTPYFHDENLTNNEIRKWFNNNKNKRYESVGLFGKPLFDLLKASSEKDWVKSPEIQVVTGEVLSERNSTFHSLRGLDQLDLFRAWDTETRLEWENRVLGCLNFISVPRQSFNSLEEASLMTKVHQKLLDAIAP